MSGQLPAATASQSLGLPTSAGYFGARNPTRGYRRFD
jgi:hypothetical protein